MYMNMPVGLLWNQDFARFKGISVLICNSTRFSWQPFIHLLSVAMATRQKLALSLSLCPNSFFCPLLILLTSFRHLCVKWRRQPVWWKCWLLLLKLDLLLLPQFAFLLLDIKKKKRIRLLRAPNLGLCQCAVHQGLLVTVAAKCLSSTSDPLWHWSVISAKPLWRPTDKERAPPRRKERSPQLSESVTEESGFHHRVCNNWRRWAQWQTLPFSPAVAWTV